ncbi:hypothetical protein KI387_036916, partial [Taxus chinensis]
MATCVDAVPHMKKHMIERCEISGSQNSSTSSGVCGSFTSSEEIGVPNKDRINIIKNDAGEGGPVTLFGYPTSASLALQNQNPNPKGVFVDASPTFIEQSDCNEKGSSAAAAAWVDSVVSQLSQSMPGTSVEEILLTMSNTFSTCPNSQISTAVESRLLMNKTRNPWKRPRKDFEAQDQTPQYNRSDSGFLKDWETSQNVENASHTYNLGEGDDFQNQNLNMGYQCNENPGFVRKESNQVAPMIPKWCSEGQVSGAEIFQHQTHGELNQSKLNPRQQHNSRVKPNSSSESQDEEGLRLLSLLLKCAEAVSGDDFEEANTILPQISELASPYGSSLQRVAAYFAEGMGTRLINSCLGICSPLPGVQIARSQNMLSAFQAFNGICPFVKFSHFTSNQAILEAFEGKSRVHIIDFDIMQGLQWPALFQFLAARPGGPPHVRITGLGTCVDALESTGKRLSSFARTLRLPFEYHGVAERVGKVDPAALHVRKGDDALAVHWLHHSLYDVTGSDTHTLQFLHRLAPNVVTVVEQEMSYAGSFLTRFVESLHYYSAMFDSLGECFSEDNIERHVVEQQLLSQEIKNILAVGGPARTGEVKFESWRNYLNHSEFRQLPMSGNAFAQAQLLLNMFPCQ